MGTIFVNTCAATGGTGRDVCPQDCCLPTRFATLDDLSIKPGIPSVFPAEILR